MSSLSWFPAGGLRIVVSRYDVVYFPKTKSSGPAASLSGFCIRYFVYGPRNVTRSISPNTTVPSDWGSELSVVCSSKKFCRTSLSRILMRTFALLRGLIGERCRPVVVSRFCVVHSFRERSSQTGPSGSAAPLRGFFMQGLVHGSRNLTRTAFPDTTVHSGWDFELCIVRQLLQLGRTSPTYLLDEPVGLKRKSHLTSTGGTGILGCPADIPCRTEPHSHKGDLIHRASPGTQSAFLFFL